MDANALLTTLDPLPYHARRRALALAARDLAAAGRLDAVLRDLPRFGRHGRRTALAAAVAAGHVPYVEAALRDPDPAIQAAALRATRVLPVSDDAIAALFDDAPAETRRLATRAIRAGGRRALAERLLDPVRSAWGDREPARLLPVCGPEVVARALPELGPALGSWAAIGRRHPGVVLDRAAAELAALPGPLRQAWWSRHGAGVAAAAGAEPARVLDLVERFCPPGPLPAPIVDRVGRLLDADPARALRLLLVPGRAGAYPAPALPRTVLRRLGRLDLPELVELGCSSVKQQQESLLVAVARLA